jgi:hypothetical protein
MSQEDSARMPCRFCAAPLAAADVNVQLAMARCGNCHAVYSFADEARERLGERSGLAMERGPVGLPKGFAVSREDGMLTVTRRWFSPAALAMVFFCIVWDGFLVAWYAGAIAAGSLTMGLFPILHLAAGVWITYMTLAQLLNTTALYVGGGKLKVRHGPLPWPGQHDLPTAELTQLWCVERPHKRKRGYSYTYEVHARGRDSKVHVLVKSLADAQQALYIEQQIEKHLRIADKPVAGELLR